MSLTVLIVFLVLIAICLGLFIFKPAERMWWLFGASLFTLLYLVCQQLPKGG